MDCQGFDGSCTDLEAIRADLDSLERIGRILKGLEDLCTDPYRSDRFGWTWAELDDLCGFQLIGRIWDTDLDKCVPI